MWAGLEVRNNRSKLGFQAHRFWFRAGWWCHSGLLHQRDGDENGQQKLLYDYIMDTWGHVQTPSPSGSETRVFCTLALMRLSGQDRDGMSTTWENVKRATTGVAFKMHSLNKTICADILMIHTQFWPNLGRLGATPLNKLKVTCSHVSAATFPGWFCAEMRCLG